MRFPVSKPTLGLLELDAIGDALSRGWITQGEAVAEFECRLQTLLGSPHVVACSSGTAALHLAVLTADVRPGDEVLVPDMTYIATANAVLYANAHPVLVDVYPDTWNMDLDAAERALTPRTTAMIVVHLYGVPCELDQVQDFAWRHGLALIEDAAEALGARYDDRACGTVAPAGCFSFYGNKLITTGEGGAVVTRDAARADRLRLLRGQGQSLVRRFFHEECGFNYRMSDLHASVGLAQLEQLPVFEANRRALVHAYRAELEGVLEFQDVLDGTTAAPWLVTGLLPKGTNRAKLAGALAEKGVETRPTFVPLHQQPYLAVENGRELFPVSADIGARGISLPTFPALRPDEAAAIACTLRGLLGRTA